VLSLLLNLEIDMLPPRVQSLLFRLDTLSSYSCGSDEAVGLPNVTLQLRRRLSSLCWRGCHICGATVILRLDVRSSHRYPDGEQASHR